GEPRVHVEVGYERLTYRVHPVSLDRRGEVEVDPAAEVPDLGADTAALVADDLRLAGGDVAGHEVAEGGVLALQVVVPVLLGDLPGVLVAVLGTLGHPDAPVVAQRL